MQCRANQSINCAIRREDFIEIMEVLDKRLNDKGKNWRHVFKVRTFAHSQHLA